jgi:hypothetical protein
MNLHEEIGKLYIENQRLLGEYQKLLGLVQRVKDGEVYLDQIQVDLAKISWSIAMNGAEFAAAIAPGTEKE